MNEIKFYEEFSGLIKRHLEEAEKSGDEASQMRLMRLYLDFQRLIKHH